MFRSFPFLLTFKFEEMVNNKTSALPDSRENAILEIIASRECKFGNRFFQKTLGTLVVCFWNTEGRRPLESRTRRCLFLREAEHTSNK